MLLKSALIALAGLGIAASAQAQPAATPAPADEAEVVNYSDLNINREPGAEAMLRRITSAADQICGRESQRTSLDRVALHQACVRSTVDRTVADLGSPMVTALNSGHAAPTTTMLASRR